jgi:hypothetical protein
MGASSTNQTPSGYKRLLSRPARRATLVLPTPPVPVSVSRRVEDIARLMSESPWRRPTKLVSSTGKLPARAVGVVGAKVSLA